MLRDLVGSEMADVAKKFGTPRRTVLMEAGAVVPAAVPLEVTDDPCLVVLSATGSLARFPLDSQSDPERLPGSAPSADLSAVTAADIVACALPTTARATIGAVTSAGRMIKFNVIEIPAASAAGRAAAAGNGSGNGNGAPYGGLSAGHPVAEFVPGLAEGETVLALAPLDGGESSGVVLGTASGIVKRVQPDYPANRDEFELITLKDDDRVIGAAYLASDDAELVFITTDAQLLRFPASSVRPQGRPAGGMAGIRLSDGAEVSWFGAIGPAVTPPAAPAGEPVVVTIAGRGAGAAARHRRRVRQGHGVRRVPGQGPGHRRRPLPALPQGRGRPDPGLGRPVACHRGYGVRCHGGPVRHDGPSRRLRQRDHPPASPPRPSFPAALSLKAFKVKPGDVWTVHGRFLATFRRSVARNLPSAPSTPILTLIFVEHQLQAPEKPPSA